MRTQAKKNSMMAVTAAVGLMGVSQAAVPWAAAAEAKASTKAPEQKSEQKSEQNKEKEKEKEKSDTEEEKQRRNPTGVPNNGDHRDSDDDHDDDDDDDHLRTTLAGPSTAPPASVTSTTRPGATLPPTTPATSVKPTTTKAGATTTKVGATTTKPASSTTSTTVAPAPVPRSASAFLSAVALKPLAFTATVTNSGTTAQSASVVITMSSTGALPHYLEAVGTTGQWVCSPYVKIPASPTQFTCTSTLAAGQAGVITVSSGSNIIGAAGTMFTGGATVTPGGATSGAVATL